MGLLSIFSAIFGNKTKVPPDKFLKNNKADFGILGLEPDEDELWGRYGAVLEKFGESKDAYWDELCLPASKKSIAAVIRKGYLNLVKNGVEADALEAVRLAYLGLANFQSISADDLAELNRQEAQFLTLITDNGKEDDRGINVRNLALSKHFGQLALAESELLWKDLEEYCAARP